MAVLLAYLPTGVGRVTSGVLSAFIIVVGLSGVIRGVGPDGKGWSRRNSRVVGSAFVLFGIGLGVEAVFGNEAPPCGGCRQSDWGGTSWVVTLVVLVVWFAILALYVVFALRRASRRR